MIRYNFFSIIVLLCLFSCSEQIEDTSTSFIKIFGEAEDEEAKSILYDSTTNQYLVLGSTSSPVLKKNTTERDFDAILLYADLSGNVTDTLLLGNEFENKASSICLTNNQDVLVAYNTEDTITEVRGTPDTLDLIQNFITVARVGSDKTIQWSKNFGLVNDNVAIYGNGTRANNTVSQVIEDSNGDILIIGSTNIVNINKEGFDRTSDGRDILMIKLDQNGNHLFTIRYGRIGIDSGVGLVERSEGGYLIMGITDSEKLDQSAEAVDVNNIIMIYVNTNGDIESTFITGTDNFDKPKKIVKRENLDQYVVLGDVNSTVQNTAANDRGFVMNVISTGSFGQVKLLSDFQTGFTSNFNSLLEYRSQYYVIGTSVNAPGADASGNDLVAGSGQMSLFKLNSAGDLSGEISFFGWDGIDAGSDLVLTPDKKLLLTGTIDFGGNSKVIGLIKTGLNGSF